MPRSLRLVLGLAFLLSVFAPARAEANNVRLNLGANYWFNQEGLFDLTFSVDTPIASFLSVGGRFGVLLASAGPKVGVPLDLLLRIRVASPISIEVTGGPWIMFDTGDDLRAHFGFGVAIQSGSISFGPEVSYLEPDAMIGARLSFRF
jgi:hypothetical protein